MAFKSKSELEKEEADKAAPYAPPAPVVAAPAPTGSKHEVRLAKRGKVPTAAQNDAKRAEIKASTAKKDGKALYWIPAGGEKFYRLGVLYPAGSMVALPLDEDPSVTWQAVDKAPAPEAPAVPAAPSGRAADREI